MKVLVTPDASSLIYSPDTDSNVLRLVGEAISFERQLAYRKDLAAARRHPEVTSVRYLNNGLLGIRHWVADQALLLFCPPADRRLMTEAFFKEQRSVSSELLVA